MELKLLTEGGSGHQRAREEVLSTDGDPQQGGSVHLNFWAQDGFLHVFQEWNIYVGSCEGPSTAPVPVVLF